MNRQADSLTENTDSPTNKPLS